MEQEGKDISREEFEIKRHYAVQDLSSITTLEEIAALKGTGEWVRIKECTGMYGSESLG